MKHIECWMSVTCRNALLTDYHSIPSFSLLPPANEVCEGYVFTGVCDSVNRGGVHGSSRGACVVAHGGRAWLLTGGACMVAHGGACVVAHGGTCMVLFGRHAWFYLGGMHGFIRGACMVLFGGCAWFYSGGMCGFIWGAVHGFIGGVCVFISGGACVVFPVFSDTMRYGQ